MIVVERSETVVVYIEYNVLYMIPLRIVIIILSIMTKRRISPQGGEAVVSGN